MTVTTCLRKSSKAQRSLSSAELDTLVSGAAE